MKKIRVISILLLIALCTAACTNSDVPTNDTSDTTPMTSDVTVKESGLYYTTTDEAIAELELKGYEYNIYLRPDGDDWSNKDFYREEMEGDNFDLAVYKRKVLIEEKFGFSLNFTYSSDTFLSELGQLVLSDDDTYDLAFPMIKQAATYAANGYLCDLSEVDYIDLDSEVWSDNFIKSTSIGNKLYMLCGDISTNAYDALTVFMFNKDLAAKYQLDDPYALVRDGKWTLDAFHEMMQTVSSGSAGDATADTSKTWGLAYPTSGGGTQLYFGCDTMLTGKDENDIPYLMMNEPRAIDVFDRVKGIFTDTSCVIGFSPDAAGNESLKSTWTSGRSLFFFCGLFGMKQYRDMTTDFGILPMPKYDEEQEDYIQFLDDWCPSPAVIPVTAKNIERSGFLIQLLAETGREHILPEYYEKCLIGKYSRDEESAEMLDYALKNYVLENANTYKWGGLSDAFLGSILGLDGQDIGAATLYATYSSQVEAAIANTLEAFNNH